MTAKHTPEPWHHFVTVGQSFVLSRPLQSGQKYEGDVIFTPGTNGNAEHDHARAVKCVNALTGVEDPDKFLIEVAQEMGHMHTIHHGDDCRCKVALLLATLNRKG